MHSHNHWKCADPPADPTGVSWQSPTSSCCCRVQWRQNLQLPWSPSWAEPQAAQPTISIHSECLVTTSWAQTSWEQSVPSYDGARLLSELSNDGQWSATRTLSWCHGCCVSEGKHQDKCVFWFWGDTTETPPHPTVSQSPQYRFGPFDYSHSNELLTLLRTGATLALQSVRGWICDGLHRNLTFLWATRGNRLCTAICLWANTWTPAHTHTLTDPTPM